ncbi:MAG: carbohydrate ABC transporter permease [Acidimicrobiales bacterium]
MSSTTVQGLVRPPASAGRRTRPILRRAQLNGWVSLVAGLIIVLMTYFPIIFVLSNSLKNGRNIFSNGVFGLFTQFDYQNYVIAWAGISRQLLNTVLVAAASIVIGVMAATLGAYAFSQLRFKGKGILFMAYIGLLMVPWTLTLIPLFLTMQHFDLVNTWWALILPYAAGAQPLLVLLFRSFFEQLPRELFQSARVDGCSERQVLLRIVAPLTRPILLTGAIIMTINVWGDFLWPSIVIQNAKNLTISAGVEAFIGNLGTNVNEAGAAFAAYMIASLPMFALVVVTMRYFISGMTEGALKL